MADSDLIKSVKKVFSEAIRQDKQYVVPPYQRGFKWNSDNVCKLLDDLKSFECGNARNSKAFYCIQNITIVPCAKGWNIVDGQQRLTTVYILLSYLRKFGSSKELSFFSSPDCLDYEVREETRDYLKKSVFSGDIWNEIIEPDKAPTKDQWYIRDVAKGIHDWFKIRGNSLDICTITNRLKFIVNNMTNVTTNNASEEEIFAGLNGGKVDLDGADLVRAILITRAAKEKYQNTEATKVKEFRMRIALELDEINTWWARKEQKLYFEQFIPENELKKSIFNHSSHPISLLYKLYYLIHKKNDEKLGVEFFENGRNFNNSPNDDHWELYESIIQLHQILQMWFEDPLLYHWIGYLIFRFKGKLIDNELIDIKDVKEDGTSSIGLILIWQLWKDSTTKDSFLSKIIKLVQVLLKNREGSLLEDIKNINKSWYMDDSRGITDMLVLMDVMVCTGLYKDLWDIESLSESPLKIKNMRKGKTRLRADYFIKNDENFEHIRSCSPNPEEGKEVRSKKEWIDHIERIYADDSNLESEESQMKSALLKILNDYQYDWLDDGIILKLNQKMNEFGQHSIGNLALLDEHVNKSYGNDPFQKKIQRIFQEYMYDKWYIRPYTLMVFEHKIHDSDRSWRWTQQNIKENAQNISNNVELILKTEL